MRKSTRYQAAALLSIALVPVVLLFPWRQEIIIRDLETLGKLMETGLMYGGAPAGALLFTIYTIKYFAGARASAQPSKGAICEQNILIVTIRCAAAMILSLGLWVWRVVKVLNAG